VHEFVRLAEQHGLPRVATVQNPYCLVNRGRGERPGRNHAPPGRVAAGLFAAGLRPADRQVRRVGLRRTTAPKEARIAKYESTRKQRWGRPEALAAARRYNALARANGLTPTRMALAWCYTKWQVASTIIGVTSVAQLDEDLDAWGTTLSPEVLAEIDKIRWESRDPAL
jgi:aryl-alcohol dehydrogenase-like predicted oxidoreductase